MDIGGLSQINK